MDKQDSAQQAIVTGSRTARFRAYGISLVIGLLIGLVPTGVAMWRAQRDNDQLRRQLVLANLDAQLARTAVLARHGDYAAARDAASRFFSTARSVMDTDATLSDDERTRLQSSLSERDDLITLLARSDPAGAERAAALYLNYRPSAP